MGLNNMGLIDWIARLELFKVGIPIMIEMEIKNTE